MQEKNERWKNVKLKKKKKRSKDRVWKVYVPRTCISDFSIFFPHFFCFIHNARAHPVEVALPIIIFALYKKFTLFIIKSHLWIFFHSSEA